MISGAASPRLSAYDEASRSAVDAAGNAADYLRRMRALRQREAVAQVRAELRRRVPDRIRSRAADRVLLLWSLVALVCAALALIVSSVGLFA
jgi:hypothetical protein